MVFQRSFSVGPLDIIRGGVSLQAEDFIWGNCWGLISDLDIISMV